MHQEITLNIRHDIPESEWNAVVDIYKGMDGWLGADDLPRWYGNDDDANYIVASVEPGGIHLTANIDSALWTSWLTVLCARLSLALRREIHDAEM